MLAKKIEEQVLNPVLNPLTPTIFHEPWWLEIVTGGNYDAAEISDNGKIVGKMYYFMSKRGSFNYSIMPPMTHFLGPAIIDDGGDYFTRFMRRAKITHELIQKLPKASIYQYKCHREVTDAIAFQQGNFDTAVQFTYEIFPDVEDVLLKNMSGQKRKKIRCAQKDLTVSTIQDPMEFWRFYDSNLQKKKIKNVCDQNICCSIIESSLSRDRGRIYAAYDKNHTLVAAIFCVWDETSSFYLMTSRTADSHQGAISLLAWEAIKDAASRGLIFDFDGLHNSTAVQFLTEFGGTVSPRFIVTRQTFCGRVALGIKNMNRENRYFY